MSINNCTFTGRIGKDCETRFTTGGDAITAFSLAVDVGWGEKKTTLWLRCNGWGQRYEKVAPYLTKGQSVGVSGELSAPEWTARDGTTKTSIELRLNQLELLGSKSGEQSAPKTAYKDTVSNPPADDFGGDIPF